MSSNLGREEWPDERLFDAWYLTDIYLPPPKPEWPEEMTGWSTRQKELWGVQMTKRAIFDEMDGARVIHRGDAAVWDSTWDGSALIQGDLDVSWGGRSPLFETKAYLPALRLRGGRAGTCQGLDWPRRQDYLNEQKRSGRPFYVVWVWPDPGTRSVVLRGERVDLLPWPPPEASLNRNRNTKGARMAYWYVDRLRPMADLVCDVEQWAGAPFQPELLSV